MLILTRKVGEQIHIGDDIIVKVLEVTKHGQVKLGTQAPKSKPVHREEVYMRLRNSRVA